MLYKHGIATSLPLINTLQRTVQPPTLKIHGPTVNCHTATVNIQGRTIKIDACTVNLQRGPLKI